MRKVKCGIKNEEWWWHVNTEDHMTAAITQFTIWQRCWNMRSADAQSDFFVIGHLFNR